jgi:hypothetical protein
VQFQQWTTIFAILRGKMVKMNMNESGLLYDMRAPKATDERSYLTFNFIGDKKSTVLLDLPQLVTPSHHGNAKMRKIKCGCFLCFSMNFQRIRANQNSLSLLDIEEWKEKVPVTARAPFGPAKN